MLRERARRVRPQRRIVWIVRFERADAPGDDVLGAEARDRRRAADGSSRASRPAPIKQDERERHLRDDETAPHVARAAAGGAAASLFAQDRVQIESGELQRRHGADDEAEQHGDAEREAR